MQLFIICAMCWTCCTWSLLLARIRMVAPSFVFCTVTSALPIIFEQDIPPIIPPPIIPPPIMPPPPMGMPGIEPWLSPASCDQAASAARERAKANPMLGSHLPMSSSGTRLLCNSVANVATVQARCIRASNASKSPSACHRGSLPIELGELSGDVHDAAPDDRKHRREPSDIVGRDSEVIVAKDDEVGMLADFQRSYPPLLHDVPSAARRLGAKRLFSGQPLLGRNAGYRRIERLPADHVPEIDERRVRRDVHRVRGQAEMDATVEHALEARSAAAPERPTGARGHPDAERFHARKCRVRRADAVVAWMGDRPVEARNRMDLVRLLPEAEHRCLSRVRAGMVLEAHAVGGQE